MKMRMFRSLPLVAALVAGIMAGGRPALAGPPFMTDDPQPLDYKHSEAYLFYTFDKTPDGKTVNLPAIEFNYGAKPNVHLHIVVPYAQSLPNGAPSNSGLGDIEIGVKLRLVQESAGRPMIGIFPMAELATGNLNKGLGNGRTWFKVPIWVQKSYGRWTTYAGGGYQYNSGPGMRNNGYAGWLVQRDLGEHLTLGAEMFSTGSNTIGAKGSTFYNLGGYIKPNANFNILFSLGHTVTGASHAVGYAALYWTWGPEEQQPAADASPKAAADKQ